MRDATLKKARQTEAAAHMDEWLNSPGLRPPRKAEDLGEKSPDHIAKAKRFRDKAAEAEQLIDSAITEERRETLSRIAETYLSYGRTT